jgi:hypothetical protein
MALYLGEGSTRLKGLPGENLRTFFTRNVSDEEK